MQLSTARGVSDSAMRPASIGPGRRVVMVAVLSTVESPVGWVFGMVVWCSAATSANVGAGVGSVVGVGEVLGSVIAASRTCCG